MQNMQNVKLQVFSTAQLLDKEGTLVFYNCLPVHNTAANKSQAQKCWAGVFEDLEFSVMDHQEYGDNA